MSYICILVPPSRSNKIVAKTTGHSGNSSFAKALLGASHRGLARTQHGRAKSRALQAWSWVFFLARPQKYDVFWGTKRLEVSIIKVGFEFGYVFFGLQKGKFLNRVEPEMVEELHDDFSLAGFPGLWPQ